MYDYDLDKATMIPNYKDIHFGKEDRWDNKFNFFGDLFDSKKESRFGVPQESCVDLSKVYDAQRYITHKSQSHSRSFSVQYIP